MRKKILLIHTGGTIGMVKDRQNGVLRPDLFYEKVIEVIPQLREIAEIEVEIPFIIDSAEMNIAYWQKLIRIIVRRYQEFNGVVITHGTDTMAYTASLLSFAFQNINFPLILTGAQRPLAELRSDARNNLINSIELACYEIPEVAIMFDNKLMRGNRTTKMHSTHFDDAFVSINYPLLAQVGVDIEIFSANICRPQGELKINNRFSSDVAVIKVFPDCNFLNIELDSRIRAVLLVGYGAGTAPLKSGNLLKRVEQWFKEGKVVVLLSEARGGSVEPWLYESGKILLEMGVVSGGDITFEAALTKLFYLLGNYENPEEISQLFIQPLAGELSGGKR